MMMTMAANLYGACAFIDENMLYAPHLICIIYLKEGIILFPFRDRKLRLNNFPKVIKLERIKEAKD